MLQRPSNPETDEVVGSPTEEEHETFVGGASIVDLMCCQNKRLVLSSGRRGGTILILKGLVDVVVFEFRITSSRAHRVFAFPRPLFVARLCAGSGVGGGQVQACHSTGHVVHALREVEISRPRDQDDAHRLHG